MKKVNNMLIDHLIGTTSAFVTLHTNYQRMRIAELFSAHRSSVLQTSQQNS
jgi:hypothetical protein